MQVNRVEIKCKNTSRNNWYYVVPIGDTHVGNVGFDEQKLRALVQWIKEKENVLWLGMGDYCECIMMGDKRFDIKSIAPEFRTKLDNLVVSQINKLVEILDPIKDKCIGLHEGNHDRKIRLQHSYNVVYEIWRGFGNKNIKLLQDAAITRLCYKMPTPLGGGYTFDIFSTHGNVGGRKGGGKINRLEDCIGFFDADIYLIAHSHIKATESKCVLKVDKNMNLQHKKKVLAVTGCFLNGYVQGGSSYVEQFMLPPTQTGVVKIMLNPRRHDIHISE